MEVPNDPCVLGRDGNHSAGKRVYGHGYKWNTRGCLTFSHSYTELVAMVLSSKGPVALEFEREKTAFAHMEVDQKVLYMGQQENPPKR